MAEQSVVDEVAGAAKRFWWLSLVRGILLVLLGIFLLVDAASTVEVFIWAVGVLLILDGIVTFFTSFRRDASLRASDRAWRLLLALVTVAAGIVLVAWPGATLSVVVWILGVWAIVAGIVGIVWSIDLQSARVPEWGWVLAGSLITALLGIILFTSTEALLTTVAVILAVYALAAGVVSIVGAFVVKSDARHLGAALRGEDS